MRSALLVLIAALTACVQTDDTTSTQASDTTVARFQESVLVLKWLEYADPVADANLAIGKQRFTLLMLPDESASLPGIDMTRTPLQVLERDCGVRLVSRANEQQSSDEHLATYARRYNQTMLAACQRRATR